MSYSGNRPTGGMGDVSVIVATHNGVTHGFIFDAIDSLLSQTIRPRQIIVVDDGSTDGTGRIIGQKYGSQVDVIVVEKAGLSRARNIGLFQVATKYASFLDDDAVFLPEKVQKQLASLDARPSAVMVFAAAQKINREGHRLGVIRSSVTGMTFPESLLGNGFTFSSTATVQVEAARKAGAFDESQSLCEDFDFFIRMSKMGFILYIDEPLILCRVHATKKFRLNADFEKAQAAVVRKHASQFFGARARHAINFFCYGSILRALSSGNFWLAREMLLLSESPFEGSLMFRRIVGILLHPVRPLKLKYKRYETKKVLQELGYAQS